MCVSACVCVLLETESRTMHRLSNNSATKLCLRPLFFHFYFEAVSNKTFFLALVLKSSCFKLLSDWDCRSFSVNQRRSNLHILSFPITHKKNFLVTYTPVLKLSLMCWFWSKYSWNLNIFFFSMSMYFHLFYCHFYSPSDICINTDLEEHREHQIKFHKFPIPLY